MRNATALAAALVLLPLTAFAYPISPRTLPRQLDEAERVVLATVKSVGTSWLGGGTVAQLDVRETWKGEHEAHLKVPYPADMICPAPPRFIEGRTVVAFLAKRKGDWRVVGLSYGTLYPEEQDVPVLREAVKSYLALPKGDSKAHTAWLVGLASRRATRWDGLYELVPAGDELHAYYDRDSQRVPAAPLAEADLRRVAEGFVSEPSSDQTLTMTLKLLEGFSHPAFDRTVLGLMDAFLQEERLPWWFPEAYELAVRRFAPKAVLPAHVQWDVPSLETYRASWKAVREQFHLPTVPAVKLPATGQPGVGSRTPS